jgi:hypothetical protein
MNAWYRVAPGRRRCDVPGLRVRRIAGFACGWFYVTTADHLAVARLLSDAEDVAAILDLDGDDE